MSITEAVAAYLADAKARELREATIYKLTIFFEKQFLAWAKDTGLRFLTEIDLTLLRTYRATWADGALAKKKKQERLTGFFWFCVRDTTPTDYFTREEFAKIIDATYLYRRSRWEDNDSHGTRLRC